jgi:S1-C subfamily serine protease
MRRRLVRNARFLRGGADVSSRLLAIVMVWAMLLATAWVAEPYVVAALFGATAPRAVTPRANLTEAERTTIAVFQAAAPSVVHVYAQAGSNSPLELDHGEVVLQTGSGIVWDTAGHVVTNFHVINGTGQIGARLSSGEFVSTRVVGVAPNYDLAVLQLERPRTALKPIAVGSSADLQVGQTAFAIGNPYGLSETLTSGIVSALHRRLPTVTRYEISGVIQTDAPINPGNSGGPLLDDAGRLIGVNTAIISGSRASAGIGFAIPVDLVNRVVAQLIRTGHTPLPGIGIVAASESAANEIGIDGVAILRTLPGSPAAAAGLIGAESAGGLVQDVITAVNGQPVHSISDLATLLEQVGAGNSADLTVTRDGQRRTVRVTVEDMAKYGRG